MSKIYKTFLCILFFGVCSLPASAVDLSGIDYNRPVNDLSRMMSRQELADTEALLQELKAATGTQIAVVTINSLDGGTIEEVSMDIAEKWGLGSAKADNGVLITIARADRRMRIEVGQGLEGDLPDAYAKRIIDQDMTPSFKAGQYGTGIRLAIEGIIKRTNPTFASASARTYSEPERPQTVSQPLSWPAKIVMVLVILFLIFTPFGRTILMAMLLSGFGRGGSSRGGRGGGGYGGGGGGFSGGGASGGW